MRGNQVEGCKKLLDYYMDEGYTLRYSGGLVPDVYQQFTKNMGIFTNHLGEVPAKLLSASPRPPRREGGRQDLRRRHRRLVLDVQINAVDHLRRSASAPPTRSTASASWSSVSKRRGWGDGRQTNSIGM